MKEEMTEKPRGTLSMRTKKGFGVLMTITLGMTNQQIVELLELIDFADTKATELLFTAQNTTAAGIGQTKVNPAPADLGVCKSCGAPNKWSDKKGKTYCSALCWQKNKTY